MVRLLQFALKSLGAKIIIARSGDEGVNKLSQGGVDLVLLDYSMPGMNGVETLANIRELEVGGQTKVIMLTARDQTAIRNDAAGLKVEAFLTKPFSPMELSQRVKSLLS